MKTHFIRLAATAWFCAFCLTSHARQLDFQGDPAEISGTVTEPGFTPVNAAALAAGVTIGGVTFRGENFAPSASRERDRGTVVDQNAFTYADVLDDFIQFTNTGSPATSGRLLITGLKPSVTYSLRIWCHDAGYNDSTTFNFTETGSSALSGSVVNHRDGPYAANTDFSFQVTISGRSSVTYSLSSPVTSALTKINGLVLVERGSSFEAEDGAAKSTMVVASHYSGFSGTGFVDYPSPADGDYVEWVVPVETQGKFHLTSAYANKSTTDRPLRFRVNGQHVGPILPCSPTSSWSTWVETAPVEIQLSPGNHVIRLEVASNAKQGPNVDYLRVTPLGTAALSLARPDFITIGFGGVAAFEPLANDVPRPLGPAHQTLHISSAPSQGTVTINHQTDTILYEHTSGSLGSDSFEYTSTDSTGVASSAVVTVTISNSTRVKNTTLNFPADAPAGGPLQVVDALPGLTFPGAVAMATVPGNPNALIVASIAGNVWMIPDTTVAAPARFEIFNVASLSNFTRGRSIYGITCHPDFATNGHIIVNYQGDLGGLPPVSEIPNISNLVLSEKATPRREVECTLRVSRFTVTDEQRAILLNRASGSTLLSTTKAAVLATELRFFNIAEEHAYHSINDCKFGPDGYLYVSFGDEGAQGEPYRNAQYITKDQYSAIVRIDIDRHPENLEPNPHYAIPTDNGVARFKIPADNPYVGPTPVYNGRPIAAADIPKVRTEIWATGFRNPFKFEIDPPTGEIWIGDVGMSRWEEISIVNKGDNAGWSYWEGNERRTDITHAIAPSEHKAPEHAYDHSNGNKSVTGGVFYRGSAYTSLRNRYIFGDYGSGRIWSLIRSSDTSPAVVTELAVGGVSAVVDFEVDPSSGQILMLQHGSGQRVMRLIEGTSSSSFPQLLSQTGAFADMATLRPQAGIVAYQPNLTFWSDHAIKSRFFAIKNLTDAVGYSRDGNWTFPQGMVFIKHFDIELNRDAPGTAVKRLETRFLVRSDEGVYGVSYHWNEEGTDATLVGIGGADFDLPITSQQQVQTQRWRIPSRGECLTCHTPSAGHALSFNTLQLNRDGSIGSVEGNFLTLLSDSGYLSGFTDDPATLNRHHRPEETNVDLETRVRSYLAVNCSYCHHPSSGTSTLWDARVQTPFDQAGILYGDLVSQAYHDPNDHVAVPGQPDRSALLTRIKARDIIGTGRFNGYSQMPPLASNVVDDAGVALVEEWLLNHANVPPAFTAETPGTLQKADSEPLGTVIGTLASLDPDIRDLVSDQNRIRYEITSGNSDSLFSLDPSTGVLRVNGLLHYGRQSSHQLSITATDQFSANPGVATHLLTIDLTDTGEKDLDGNGLPDFWETGYALQGDSAGDDTNKDGISNFFHYLAGGDPTVPNSTKAAPEIANEPAEPGMRLTWIFRNGMILGTDYFLQGSTDLASWQDLKEGLDFEPIDLQADRDGFSKITVRTLSSSSRHFVRLSNKAAPVPLFNGVNLDGWEIKQGTLAMYQAVPASGGEPAYIEGTANGSLGMLATTAQYGDFDLQYEFWVEDPLNSGVQIRSFMSNGQVKGYQVEIDPSVRSWSGGIYEQNGRTSPWLNDLSTNAAAREAFLPGQWNHMRVLAVGPRVRTWINGIAAADYTETLSTIPTSGFLALQVHQGDSSLHNKRVRFRNIRITSD